MTCPNLPVSSAFQVVTTLMIPSLSLTLKSDEEEENDKRFESPTLKLKDEFIPDIPVNGH